MNEVKQEAQAGFISGQLHDDCDPLCQQNLKKVETGVKSESLLVRVYWRWYRVGLRCRPKKAEAYLAEGLAC